MNLMDKLRKNITNRFLSSALVLSSVGYTAACDSGSQIPQTYNTQGCIKDSDCKGERICDYESGQCVSPVAPLDASQLDGGSRTQDSGSTHDSFVPIDSSQQEDTYVAPPKDTYVAKDTFVPKDTSPKDTYVAKDTFVPKDTSPKDTYVAKDTFVSKDTYVAKDTTKPYDAGCVKKKLFEDADKDGFGSKNFKELCTPSGLYGVTNSKDCDDSNSSIFPGAKESCDNKDNDCDGKIDEGFNIGTKCDNGEVGVCYSAGVVKCVSDQKSSNCDVSWMSASAEICDNKDNDCDGKTDENLTKKCSTGCGTGLEECVSGTWKNCSAKVCPTEVSTDVLGDLNCDGKVDLIDSQALYKYLKGDLKKFTDPNYVLCTSALKNANVNCSTNINGKPTLNKKDEDLLFKYATGQYTFFPGCEERIAAICSVNGEQDVYVISPEGKDLMNITKNFSKKGYAFYSLAWSPDQRSIAVWEGNVHKNIKMHLGKGLQVNDLLNIPKDCANGFGGLDWSSDDKFAISCNKKLYLLDQDGKNLKTLVDFSKYGDYLFHPTFNANKKWRWIGYSLLNSSGWDLWQKHVTQVFNVPMKIPNGCREPEFHPKVQNVLVVACPNGNNSEIRYYQNSATLEKTLTSGFDDSQPTWSPDGSRVAFMRQSAVHIVDVKSKKVTKLNGLPGKCQSVKWSH